MKKFTLNRVQSQILIFTLVLFTLSGCNSFRSTVGDEFADEKDLPKGLPIFSETESKVIADPVELETELSYKEKCAGYLTEEKSRFDREDMVLDGIYFSEKLNSCVSIWLDYGDYTYRYFDVLTNEFLVHVRYTYDDVNADYELTDEKAEEYEDSLSLIK